MSLRKRGFTIFLPLDKRVPQTPMPNVKIAEESLKQQIAQSIGEAQAGGPRVFDLERIRCTYKE